MFLFGNIELKQFIVFTQFYFLALVKFNEMFDCPTIFTDYYSEQLSIINKQGVFTIITIQGNRNDNKKTVKRSCTSSSTAS